MSLPKLILVGMGLLSLVILFNITNAGETWTRKYDNPGQQEQENRQALQRETQEQQKEAEERAAYKKRRLREKESGDPEVKIEVKGEIFGPPLISIVPANP